MSKENKIKTKRLGPPVPSFIWNKASCSPTEQGNLPRAPYASGVWARYGITCRYAYQLKEELDIDGIYRWLHNTGTPAVELPMLCLEGATPLIKTVDTHSNDIDYDTLGSNSLPTSLYSSNAGYEAKLSNSEYMGKIFEFDNAQTSHKTSISVFSTISSGVLQFTYKDEIISVLTCPAFELGTLNYSDTYIGCDNQDVAYSLIAEILNYLDGQNRVSRLLEYSSRSGWTDMPEDTVDYVKSLDWDSIILNSDLKKEIKEDVEAFLSKAMYSTYKALNIQYKRGYILMGPPGCGKTLLAKVIASTYNMTLLYITKITDPDDITAIYHKARKLAPCVIVFEDIDTLIQAWSRTELLNCLDGVNSFENVLTIATTNHPEMIDEAFYNRPSRFDKKWVFSPPSKSTAEVYLINRLSKVYDTEDIDYIVDKLNVTSDEQVYSFADLQELVMQFSYQNKIIKLPIDDAATKAIALLRSAAKLSNSFDVSKEMVKKDSVTTNFSAARLRSRAGFR